MNGVVCPLWKMTINLPIPQRYKRMLQAMTIVIAVIYMTLVLYQSVSGVSEYQVKHHQFVRYFCQMTVPILCNLRKIDKSSSPAGDFPWLSCVSARLAGATVGFFTLPVSLYSRSTSRRAVGNCTWNCMLFFCHTIILMHQNFDRSFKFISSPRTTPKIKCENEPEPDDFHGRARYAGYESFASSL